MFASSEYSQLSTDQGHVVKLPDVRHVWSSIHALDHSANFVITIFLTIFCWKADINESLGCSLEMCSAAVVVSQLQWFSFLFDQLTDIMIETNTFTDSSGGIALASSSCSPWHTVSLAFSYERDPQTCLCPPRSTPTVSCLHPHTLASGQFLRHLQNVPIQSVHVWRSARDFLTDILR